MLSQMVQQHPEMEYMLSNPEMLRSMLTPENIRMSMNMMQSMRGMPGMSPFGLPMAPPPPAVAPGPQPAAQQPCISLLNKTAM